MISATLPCPGRLSGNPAWSIDGFKVIENPPGVFHATVVLSRVAKRAGFTVWLKKRKGKGGQKLIIFKEDEKHWLNLKNSSITTHLVNNLISCQPIIQWKSPKSRPYSWKSFRIDSHFDADFAEMRTARLITKRFDQVL